MKTMTVRDVRQKWPEAEKALAEEGEIVVTRDSKPVARILPIQSHGQPPARTVDWDALALWRKRLWKTQPRQPSTDKDLARDRADRG